MSNLITKTTELAMEVTLKYICPGDTVIDATCGTGQDTLVLAEAVGGKGQVIGFDIQEKALEMTEERLKARGITNVRLIKDSFVNMKEYAAEESVSAAVFNLGYLPGGDHSLTTEADTSREGIGRALEIIKPGGVVTVVMYDGHEAGREEKRSILEFSKGLDPRVFHAAYVSLVNQQNHPPEILWITKKH